MSDKAVMGTGEVPEQYLYGKCLDVAGVMKYLGISKSAAYQLFYRNDFPGKLIDGVGYRVMESDLIKYIRK